MKKIFFLSFLVVCASSFAQVVPPYKNSRLSVEARTSDLLRRMTPEEKFWQMFMIPSDFENRKGEMYQKGIFGLQVDATAKGDAAGQMLNYNSTDNALQFARKLNKIQQFFVEKTRLGIPVIFFDEALHGLVRSDATVYPQAIGLAATFDTVLMHHVAANIAKETRGRGVRQVLSPVINIADDVRWGRVEETYGEDPFLSSAMAVSFVSEFERNGVITTPKHFVANVGDGGRDSYPIYYNERHLREIHFPPFKASFMKGGARSVMTSYNSVNGSSSSSNSWLLQKKLKRDWKFGGFAISDANAVGGDVVLLFTARDYADAGCQAVNNGLDVIFQTDYQHSELFMPPFLDGSIDTNRINDAVTRVLRAKFELGLFDDPYVSETNAQKLLNDSSGRQIALEAALKSVVLLKNDNNLLPLKNVKKIAVIGQDASVARMGGYSGPGKNAVSILDGLKRYARDKQIEVSFALGADILSKEYDVISSDYLKSPQGEEGLLASFYNNIDLSGQPAVQKIAKRMDFLWTLSLPDRTISTNFYSGRWEGTVHSPKSGTFKIGIEGNDGFRLYIDDSLILDNWKKVSYSTILKDFYFEKDREYNLRMEFFEPVGRAKLRLIWNVGMDNDWQRKIDDAVAAAKNADVAVITAGIHEGEFQDRGILSLPGHQEELIDAVVKTGKPVVIVLIGGSAVTMNNWLPDVPAVIDAWYPGEQGGNAIAKVLFGGYNPGGKLPVTFPISEGQLPLFYNHKPTGRTEDYYNLTGLPLFPFGYGLSYTTFEYSQLRFEKNNISPKDSTHIFFKIKNTGKMAGDEVVQLYIHDILSSITQPVIQLKGFQRIHLEPGESRDVNFLVTPELLKMLDKNLNWIVEPGDFDIMIGSSSRDIRLKSRLTVKQIE